MGFNASPMFRDLLVFNWKAVVASLELSCFYHDQKCVLDQKQLEKKKNKKQGPSPHTHCLCLSLALQIFQEII